MASVDHPLTGVNPEVFNDDLWAWIESNSAINTTELRLKYGTNEPYSSAIAQIEAKNKYAGKFWELFEERWIFPTGIGLEQSSSLKTAAVKSRFFKTPYSADDARQGRIILDTPLKRRIFFGALVAIAVVSIIGTYGALLY